ncbi:hypothetical protein ZIOFF_067341 [Zingiber officinale]|uniref:Uncharacterized protein n=1 Tax=Zingiber officinale TaxID=94328 RepID=A0A8J5C5N8_ZINOF|nr:hypothetical protein ZIOFF_067341 [Zingiber officinale]
MAWTYIEANKLLSQGSLLSIDTGLGLMIDESHTIDINEYAKIMEDKVHAHDSNTITENNAHPLELKQLYIENGWREQYLQVQSFPFHVVALWKPDNISHEQFSCADSPHRQNMVDGMRTIALKLEFGAFRNQIFER